jgi:hypothetical protein
LIDSIRVAGAMRAKIVVHAGDFRTDDAFVAPGDGMFLKERLKGAIAELDEFPRFD